uniref:Uncharacterized protein n=1 Tax=Anguilla anguilla TaxID=7936 RepID=A0A0E9TAJ8_ANGAN
MCPEPQWPCAVYSHLATASRMETGPPCAFFFSFQITTQLHEGHFNLLS